ncbi:transcriptional initiation protein Tat [Haloferax sp. DFSO52]|uniref:transcriptional initiation protein Tat n=1 Tax=Haloferax sp. DFSO52 TaxID=3388505 RepID=UPI003A893829
MSPDEQRPPSPDESNQSTLSRRQLLGLLGGGGVLAGIGWFAPEWLPDPVTDTVTTMYPDPSSNYVWRPPVSDERADEAVQRLEETVERATELRSQVDLDSVDEHMRFHLRGSPAGGHLESAKDERNARDRLQHATTGLQYAGETVGYATVALGEDDPEFLVERGRELNQRIEAVLSSIAEYRVSDPGRDLAFLYSIERQLSSARISTSWGDSDNNNGPEDGYSSRNFASEWGSQLQAEQRIQTAQYHRDQYRETLGDDATSYREVLTGAIDQFRTQIEQYPTRDEMRTKFEDELELDQQTPYGAARWELYILCFDNDFRFVDSPLLRGLPVKQFVVTGHALLARQAHEFVLDELDVDPGDTDYDSGRSFRAKRQAMREYRATRNEYDSNFAGVVASEAASRIRGGDVGLSGRFDNDLPAWRERVEASVYYLLGAGMMRNLGTVLDSQLKVVTGG